MVFFPHQILNSQSYYPEFKAMTWVHWELLIYEWDLFTICPWYEKPFFIVWWWTLIFHIQNEPHKSFTLRQNWCLITFKKFSGFLKWYAAMDHTCFTIHFSVFNLILIEFGWVGLSWVKLGWVGLSRVNARSISTQKGGTRMNTMY